ncbi:MAG: hypothetical protein B7Y31_10200, partial [Novosphingobium sp. 16-62-11]
GDTVVTENVAILTFLGRKFPEAGLFPDPAGGVSDIECLSDLSFVASTLHPIVTRIRMAPFFAGPAAAQAVWDAGATAMDPFFALIDNRLAERRWWYGDQWAVIDGYLNWVFFRVAGAGYDTSRFPAFAAHAQACAQRPSIQRALGIERAQEEVLAARGLLFVGIDVIDGNLTEINVTSPTCFQESRTVSTGRT